VLTKAADLGLTFWDTSDIYGPFTNEELLGRWFKLTGRRKEIFLATKFGGRFENGAMSVRGDPEYVRQCIEGSLKRLGVDYVDLYYQHRVDYNTKIEDTITAMAALVKEGKVRYLGMSECSNKTLLRALKVHPIAAVQLEYSLFALEIEAAGLKKTCDENGIAVVCYSPLGRGLLTGEIKARSDFKEGDFRLHMPRFSEENFQFNMDLIEKLRSISEKKKCTPGQLSLAWLMKQGENVIPLFGTTKIKNLEDNLLTFKVELTPEEVKEIRELSEKAEIKGERYSPSEITNNDYSKDTI